MGQRRFSPRPFEDYLILAVGIVLAVALRASLLNFTTLDFRDFHGTWYDFIQKNGGVWALRNSFSNFSYFPFLFGYEMIPFRYLALVLLTLIVLLARRLYLNAAE